MRNALIHDYLNIEPEIINIVIKKATYEELFLFAEQGLIALKDIYSLKHE